MRTIWNYSVNAIIQTDMDTTIKVSGIQMVTQICWYIIVVEVTLKGVVDPITGMLCNLTELKTAMRVSTSVYIRLVDIYLQTVIEQLDHKHLDMDIDYFRNNHTRFTK